MKLATAVRNRVGEGAKPVSDDVRHPGGYRGDLTADFVLPQESRSHCHMVVTLIPNCSSLPKMAAQFYQMLIF